MSQPTKSCALTELEIKTVMVGHCHAILQSEQNANVDEHIERINYLNKRLKAFKEPEENKVAEQVNEKAPAPQGWGVSG